MLRGRLLSVADLPDGWSAAKTSSNAAKLTSTPCLAGLATTAKGSSYQTAAFVEGKSIPNLGEALATGTRSERAWNKAANALARCRSATLVLGGTKVNATVHCLAFPRVGHNSSA